MNKRFVAGILTAVLAFTLVPAAVFAYTGEDGTDTETGVIVREIPAEEVTESGTETETGFDWGDDDDTGGTILNEDGSVTTSGGNSGSSGSTASGTAGISSIEDLLSSLESGTTTTEEKKIGTVKTDGSYLNVRSGGGLDYGIIDTLNNGDTVEVLEDHGDWLYVAIPEHTGYVCADYMDVRTVPVEVKQDGSLSISLDPELIRQMLEQAEESGTEVTSSDLSDLGLTPEGNLTLVDDYGSAGTAGKQFITLATKSGNIFYLIIDRDDDGNETVHFLNQVDENDLFALMDEAAVTEMKEEIAAEEAAKEAEEAAKKAEQEQESQIETPEVEKPEKKTANPLLLALPLILVFGGVGGYLYLKTKREKTRTSRPDPDADFRYDDDDDMDIYDLPEEPDERKSPADDEDADYWLDDEDA